jgi:hypothetical protein
MDARASARYVRAMRFTRSGLISAGALLTTLLCASLARASDIGPDGQLVFAADALATYGFESFADLQAAGACTVGWALSSSGDQLDTSPLTEGELAPFITGDALQGSQALRVQQGQSVGLALRDPAVFGAQVQNRITVSMWGRSFGAEPVLEMVYGHNTVNVGPGRVHVIAIRTGRETSDGWVEYSTGPIDGSSWTTPLRAIVLTARYATDQGTQMLIDSAFGPSSTDPPQILDPTAYAVIDAVEVDPAGAPASTPATCTQATVDTDCGAVGECEFGHCVDAALVWGPVPQAADHRADLISRWAFQAQSLISDRQAAVTAQTSFGGVVPAFMAQTSPRGYYGQLNQLVTGLRDSHTTLGVPPSDHSAVYPLAYGYSGPLDVCLGLAENDLDTGETVFAVFSVGKYPSTTEALVEGDVLTSIDGLTPSAWLTAVAPRFTQSLPSDPAADPSYQALMLPNLIGTRASTVTFSRCQAGGGCAALPPIDVAQAAFQLIENNGAFDGDSEVCTLRFQPSVTNPPYDGATYDVPVAQTANGITSIQLDGFEGAYDDTSSNPYSAWETPMESAFSGGSSVLVDARLGHGGRFVLGKWLFALLRGSDQPYGMLALPRGAYDDIDPPWLFTPIWDACSSTDYGVDTCNWSGNQTTFTTNGVPAGEASKIAWVNGNDVSMNDIVPRLMSGRSTFRVFGPHPSHGAYGEISYLPPVEPSWGWGSMQVLDMRFGATLADAVAGTWQSGQGVVPDQMVLQKVSDILLNQDTVLAAAQTWLAQ